MKESIIDNFTFEDAMEHFSDYHFVSGDCVFDCEEATKRFTKTFGGTRVQRQVNVYMCMRRAKRK
jgi:hypothetical protein